MIGYGQVVVTLRMSHAVDGGCHSCDGVFLDTSTVDSTAGDGGSLRLFDRVQTKDGVHGFFARMGEEAFNGFVVA